MEIFWTAKFILERPAISINNLNQQLFVVGVSNCTALLR